MLATYDQGSVVHASDEYDATILLYAELVRSPCVPLDIGPLCFRHLSVVEKFVVTSNDNLRLSVEVYACEQAAGVAGQVALLVVPVLHSP